MKKILLILLGGIFVFFVFRFCLFKIDDYQNTNKCNSSKFIADGERIYIRFYMNVNETEMLKTFSILSISKNGKRNKILYYKSLNIINTYYTDSKILKSDTILIEGKQNKIYKIYDFKNTATRIKAGKDKGKYYCSLYYKNDYSQEENFDYNNTIFIKI